MDVVGVILMIAGIAALLLSLGFALFNRDETVPDDLVEGLRSVSPVEGGLGHGG